jgi:DNA polymerase III subunit epsilon
VLSESTSGWSVVDVETSGSSPGHHRVLSVAVVNLNSAGEVEDEFTTLFNPGCDPGPVHIHGLTPERLAGAPTFDQIAPQLTAMLQGRTMVAHNASFDHGFLASELHRARIEHLVNHRLCTMALSRRLQLDVPNHKLSTLARHWKIQQRSAHDALDDARVTSQVFAHSADLARSLGLPLPVVNCGLAERGYPATVTRVPCVWRNPGRLEEHGPLVQGMKVVVTGGTRIPRAVLAVRMSDAGLDVMNSVSRQTSVVVCNDPRVSTRKLENARAQGIRVISEDQLVSLLGAVLGGTAKSTVHEPAAPANRRPTKSRRVEMAVSGAWSGRRVLVLGGDHALAATVRTRLIEIGAKPSVNLSAGVTHVVVLDGGGCDKRMARIRERSLPLLTAGDVLGREAIPESVSGSRGRQPAPADAAQMLSRGAVMDLPSPADPFVVNVAWSAEVVLGFEIDVVAFELDADGHVTSDDDFVFFNQPVSGTGGARLSIDGDCEQGVHIDLTSLDPATERIAIAAAIDGDATFGQVGALSMEVAGRDTAIASAVLDAATSERTMLIAEVYRRRDQWRLRAIGQGYDHGLAQLVSGYGIEVDA